MADLKDNNVSMEIVAKTEEEAWLFFDAMFIDYDHDQCTAIKLNGKTKYICQGTKNNP